MLARHLARLSPLDGSATVSVTGLVPRMAEKRKLVPPASRVMTMRLSRSEEHTSELQSLRHLVCRLLLEKKKDGSDGRLVASAVFYGDLSRLGACAAPRPLRPFVPPHLVCATSCPDLGIFIFFFIDPGAP